MSKHPLFMSNSAMTGKPAGKFIDVFGWNISRYGDELRYF